LTFCPAPTMLGVRAFSEAPMILRDATAEDVPGILAIYNEVIATSTAVYIDDPVSLADRQAWFAARQAEAYPVLVATEGDAVLGYASFGTFRGPWPGFRYSVEHSVHIRNDQRGKGVGGLLIEPLIARAEAMGKHIMIGAIDADNAGSIRFHERFGFEISGHMKEVGFKFGRWLDLVWMQRRLG
jgi:L-amino acid N-acyltransferase YncA